MDQALRGAFLSVVFAILGFGLLFLGYRVIDALTPGSISHKILEEGNVAAAILAGAFVIALGIIVAQAIS